jgi:hypothetical protein
MTTAISMIDTAYVLAGYKDAREALDGQDAAYGLDRLNDMLDGWNTQGLFLFTTNEVVATTSGLNITIGTGGTINTPAPVSLPNGSFIRISGLDYPIAWISDEQYQLIQLKGTASTIAVYGNYTKGYPTGTLNFWPTQTLPAEYHIFINTQLTEFATLNTDVALPQGYRRAITYSLAEELCIGLREPSPMLVRNAANARRVIRQANAVVPTLMYADSGTSPIARFLAGA